MEHNDEPIQGNGDEDTDDYHIVDTPEGPQKFFGPFEERFKDIIVHEMIVDGQFIQVNGYDLDMRKVWIQLIVQPDGYTVKHTTHPSV